MMQERGPKAIRTTNGWHVDHPEPGTLNWTLPHGRTYTTEPDAYPT